MNRIFVILLLTLLSLPIIWNGVTLFHYVVEHTHTFCQEDLDHSHSNSESCLSIFLFSDNHSHNQFPSPTKSEFKELKQYITLNLDLTLLTVLSLPQMNFVDISLPDDLFVKDVFHPPIPS